MPDSKAVTPNPPMVQGAPAGSDPFDLAYPLALRTKEYKLLHQRRMLGHPAEGRLVGCGLSGGGIRSATFSLGVFQGLARQPGLLGKIDFLSTVSGGGYFGAFLGRLFSRDYIDGPGDVEDVLQSKHTVRPPSPGDDPTQTKQIEERKAKFKPRVLGFLRENARYLSPNGAGDETLAGAAVLRNLVSVHLVLSVFWLTFFLAVQLLRFGAESAVVGGYRLNPVLTAGSFWGSPLLLLPLAAFVLAVFPLGWAYWLIRPERRALDQGAATITPWASLALVVALSLWLMPSYWGSTLRWVATAVFVVSVATLLWRGAVWMTFRTRAKELETQESQARESTDPQIRALETQLYLNRWIPNRLALWLSWALVVTFALLALALIDSLGQSLYALLVGHAPMKWLAGFFSALTLLGGYGRKIAAFFSKGPTGERPSVPLNLLAGVAALVLVGGILVSLDAFSHAIAWRFQEPADAPAAPLPPATHKVTVQVQADRVTLPSVNVKVTAEGDRAESQKPVLADLERQTRRDRRLAPTLIALIAGFLLSILIGQTWSFLNKSSFHPMYADRLTRAYLGASNEARLEADSPSLTEPVKGDDEDLAGYWPPPETKGTFLHLINVTINETIDGRSQIQQQDRKGLGMALGPCGLSAGVQHHMLLSFGEPKNADPVGVPVTIFPSEGYKVFDYQDKRFAGEPLPLGAWVGISGAAFSTGIGMRTSLGLSLLAGLGNVRLGRWWDSGILREKTGTKLGLRIEKLLARVFPVQVYLIDELLARFPGTARRHWYLSDGGHFENMGGYELVRRRLDRIVIVDGEQDDGYGFEGLANLIRKARLDFGAEIEFLDEDQLDGELKGDVRREFGTLQQLRRGRWQEDKDTSVSKGRRGKLLEVDPAGHSLAHVAMARITYSSPAGPAESRLLYIKPTLTGDEPEDLIEYHKNHPAFPHESTLDQFFDEAQWESYRRLGQHIAEKLFGPASPLLEWMGAESGIL
ncbi:MAG TPA: hypothetical protein VGS07_02295 [Thermoanaerobaculia bacterium]|jgi:hypothetical protein|nr:hypothetical protein [Thermoanaerobaculia bacterium]